MKTDPKNLALVSKLLNEMSNEILCLMRTNGLESVLNRSTTHLYRENYAERISVRKGLIEPWRTGLHDLGIDLDTMAVEMITFHRGGELNKHFHKDAYAVITLLGEWEGVPEPKDAFYWLGGKSAIFPVVFSKVTLQVTPGTIHEFLCLDPERNLSFLSVQSKCINEDFHLVNRR